MTNQKNKIFHQKKEISNKKKGSLKKYAEKSTFPGQLLGCAKHQLVLRFTDTYIRTVATKQLQLHF